MSETIHLTKPITAHGAEVSELTLKEPTTDDIIACGYPLMIADGAVLPQAGPVAKYIARLGGVPPSSVKQLSPADFNACMTAIVGFFGDSSAMA